MLVDLHPTSAVFGLGLHLASQPFANFLHGSPDAQQAPGPAKGKNNIDNCLPGPCRLFFALPYITRG